MYMHDVKYDIHVHGNGLVMTERLIRQLFFMFKNYKLSHRLSRQSVVLKTALESRIVATARARVVSVRTWIGWFL